MIRRYEEKDIEAIVKMENKILGTSIGYNILFDRLDDLNFLTLVYEDMGINGYISSYFDGETLEILNLCLYETYQNKGLGGLLLDELIRQTKNSGLRRIVLEVRSMNAQAIRFYEKNGFRVVNVRRNYYGNDDAYLMEKVVR